MRVECDGPMAKRDNISLRKGNKSSDENSTIVLL